MYTLVDGVEFYDKDEIDTIVESITGGTIPNEDNIRTELTTKIDEEAEARTAADEALGTRIDSEATKRMDADALFSKLIAGEVESRINADTAFANQLTAIEQLHTTLISPNGFIDSDGDAVNINDGGKSIRQIAHEEFYRQLITDADDVKTQLDTLKELADYLQRNPSIITDMYNKLGITWSVDNPTDFGTFDFSTVLSATNVDDAVLELYNTFTGKIGDLTQLTTTFKNNIVGAVNELDAEISNEVTARTDADTALGTRIDEEVTARTDADTVLGTRIDEEVTARTDADTALGTRIDEEVTARTDADTALGTRIDEEAEARTNADTELDTRIDEEVTARTDADTALGTRIDEEVGYLDSLKTTDKSSTVAAINELYDAVQQGGGSGGGTGGDTGNTVDYYVIEIEANFDGIKPNEPLRFEGDLDPDVASGITEAVAAGKALMLKIVDSSTDGSSPSTTIVITNYSYNDAGVYSFDMNDATITGNQIIVVDYNASIRPDLGDYSGYATLSTVTVPEGGGTVVPSESSNVYVLQLTYDAEFDIDVDVTIALTPEQNAAVTDAITNRVPIIAIVTSAGGLSTVLTPIYTTASDGGGGGVLSNTLMSLSGPSAPSATTITLNLSADAGRASLKIESADLGGGSGGGSGGNTGDNVYVLNITADTPYDGNVMADGTFISTATLSEQQWSDLESALATGKSVVVNADFGSELVYQCNRVFGSDISSIVCAGTLIGAGEGQIFSVQQAQVANFENRKCNMYFGVTDIDRPTGGGDCSDGGSDIGNTATNCEQFTYVIDSNEKLAEWANNDRSKGQDYTSVLIRKGEWRCVLPSKSASVEGVTTLLAYIDIGHTGTQYIYGEAGNKLILESPFTVPAGNPEKLENAIPMAMVFGLAGYNPYASEDGPDATAIATLRKFRMCNVNIECTGEAHYFIGCILLYNLSNCNIDMRVGGGYPVMTACYQFCYNLTCCSGSAVCDARSEGDVEGAAGAVSLAAECFAVSKCYPSSRFKRMLDGVEITGTEGNTDSVMLRSYASWSSTSAYECADTANGGFNNVTNPSA